MTGYRLPYGYKDYKGQDATTVIEEMQEAGLTDIETKVIYDLSLDKKDEVGQITALTIDGSKDYEKDELIPLDSKILIKYHDLKKHKVKIHVNFEGNWFFNRYDVKLIVDKEHSEKMTHGENADFEFELKEGDYTIKFKSEEDKSVQGQAHIRVTSDMEVSYDIHCYVDRVDIKEDYKHEEEQLEANQVRMSCDINSLVNENYKDVVDLLQNFGFINITTIPVYDIHYGITLEETCADVTIDGDDSFRAGDIFNNDDKVIVYYHMKEEAKTEEEDSTEQEEAKEVVYTKAYMMSFGQTDMYYLFDEDTKTVATFKTDEKMVSIGKYKGNFEESVEMTFEYEGNVLKEKFKIQGDGGVLIDARQYSYQFKKVDIKKALKELEKVKGNEANN